MSRRRTRNTRMTPARQRKKELFAEVNARGGRERWSRLGIWVGRLLRCSVAMGLIYGIYVGATLGYKNLFWENPDYALKDVSVKTDGSSLTREQVIATAGLKFGKNILSYSLPDLKEALRKLPQVEVAEVRRYLPNRMEIRIKERKPVAWVTASAADDVRTNQKSYLVDSQGEWFRPRLVVHEFETLPVITGVVTDNLQPREAIRSEELMAALELIEKNTKSPRFQVRTIDISKGYCVIVKSQDGMEITFGLSDIDAQLAKLDEVRKLERSLSQQVASTNLIPSRNIPIRWVPPLPPEDADFPPKPVETAKPATKDLKTKPVVKKPEPKKESKPEPKKEPKKSNPDNGLYKPFLMRA